MWTVCVCRVSKDLYLCMQMCSEWFRIHSLLLALFTLKASCQASEGTLHTMVAQYCEIKVLIRSFCITANSTNLVKYSILFLFYLNSPILFAISSSFPMTQKILQTDDNMKILVTNIAFGIVLCNCSFLRVAFKFCVQPGVLQLM